VSLRARANDEGDKMARCFEESKRAYTSGDGARAKTLSNEGKEHKAKMEELHLEASAWVYASESPRRWIDDHLQMISRVFRSLENNEVSLIPLFGMH